MMWHNNQASTNDTNADPYQAMERSFASSLEPLHVPPLTRVQTESFSWFQCEGLAGVFQNNSPIDDELAGRFRLSFGAHYFKEPRLTEEECRAKEKTFSSPLYVNISLEITAPGNAFGEIKAQPVFLGNIPMMTRNGTFVINGSERVVINQLIRSPGVYFTAETEPKSGDLLATAKIIPNLGVWMVFETHPKGYLTVSIDQGRRIPITTLLRVMGCQTDADIFEAFQEVDTDTERPFITNTLERDSNVKTVDEAHAALFRVLRPGEPLTMDRAYEVVEELIFDERQYNLEAVGRYKLNFNLQKPFTDEELSRRVLSVDDIIGVVQRLIQINNRQGEPDDVDHLINRRVRTVGELLRHQASVGLFRMKRVIQERMVSYGKVSEATPTNIVSPKVFEAAFYEFFASSQLSQFMDQTNPLAEMTHKRRLSALGPGGLTRDTAGFAVRDVHHSHYGRICPIETPEGPNVGLLTTMATFAKLNSYGFLETPYRKVIGEIENTDEDIVGRTLEQDVYGPDGNIWIRKGRVVPVRFFRRISNLETCKIRVRPYVSMHNEDIHYLSADKETTFNIAQFTSALDEKRQFEDASVQVRSGESFALVSPESVDYIDVASTQLVSLSTSMIPFLENDDANRALMGANMQRQAVPLIRPEWPAVGTGAEKVAARDSGYLVQAASDGVVTSVTANNISVLRSDGVVDEYPLIKFKRSNQGTSINQKPVVNKSQRVKAGQVLADTTATQHGRIALGQNVLVAFMSWEGYNFEDAILLSSRLVKEDKFTSVHITKYEVDARQTNLGAEAISADIPGVSKRALRKLDEKGVIRVGTVIRPGDILVGKLTPKPEDSSTPEDRLVLALFGEMGKAMKDDSLRAPNSASGKIIKVEMLDREELLETGNGKQSELEPGVLQRARVWTARTRKIIEGDKMAGRHGNKGVVAKIMPEEDMPYLEDGTPVDIILNPIGVPSRMNLGQMMETHLGMAAVQLGFKSITPVFDGATTNNIEDALAEAWIVDRSGAVGVASRENMQTRSINKGIVRKWMTTRGYDYEAVFVDRIEGRATEVCLREWLAEDMGLDIEADSIEDLRAKALSLNREEQIAAPTLGKSVLYDGRSGQRFAHPVSVGYIYMLKLNHLIEDKIHTRSTGPYSLITQQPLGGKAKNGGQRFGEMEVWALEAYSAANNLQEMITLKSDDMEGRVAAYSAILKGETIDPPGVPESFYVLMKELQSMGLSLELLRNSEGEFVGDDTVMYGEGQAVPYSEDSWYEALDMPAHE